MKINLFYDHFDEHGAIPNGLNPRWFQSFRDDGYGHQINVKVHFLRDLLDFLEIEYTVKHISQYKNSMSDDYNLFVVEPGWIEKTFVHENFLYYVSSKAKHFIEQTNAKLLIWYASEGHDMYDDIFMRPLHQTLNLCDFRGRDITLVFGDLNANYNYDYWLNTKGVEYRNNRIGKVFGFDTFELDYYRDYQYRYVEENNTHELIDAEKDNLLERDRPFSYLSTNGAAREPRLYTVCELARRDLLKHGKVSMLCRYGGKPSYVSIDKFVSPRNQEYQGILSFHQKFVKEKLPMYLDVDVDTLTKNDRVLDKNLYLDTYMSLVNETVCSSPPPGLAFKNANPLFITEKTFKPFVMFHPFLITGGPGILSYLHSCAYETFPEIFDESYDSEQNAGRRIGMVLDQLHHFCGLTQEEKKLKYKKVWPKLTHNYHHFLRNRKTINGRKKWYDMIEKVFNER